MERLGRVRAAYPGTDVPDDALFTPKICAALGLGAADFRSFVERFPLRGLPDLEEALASLTKYAYLRPVVAHPWAYGSAQKEVRRVAAQHDVRCETGAWSSDFHRPGQRVGFDFSNEQALALVVKLF